MKYFVMKAPPESRKIYRQENGKHIWTSINSSATVFNEDNYEQALRDVKKEEQSESINISPPAQYFIMQGEIQEKSASRLASEIAVLEIIRDLRDRRSLSDTFNEIPEDIQIEIFETWTNIVEKLTTNNQGK